MYNILKNSLLVILMLMFCVLPSVQLSCLRDGTQTAKFISFGIIVYISLVLYLASILINNPRFEVNRVDLLFLFIITYLVISPYLSYQGPGFSFKYFELFGLFVIYIILRSLSPVNYCWLFMAIIIGGGIQAVYCNLQLYGLSAANNSLYSATGSFYNPGPYAGYLASVIPALLGLCLYRHQLTTNELIIPKNKIYSKIFSYLIPVSGGRC